MKACITQMFWWHGTARTSLPRNRAMFCSLLAGFCIFAIPFSVMAIDKPLGYERFTSLTVNSNIFTEKTAKFVYENYAQPLTLGVPVTGAVTEKRLIDIEAHRDKNGNLTLSGVWIENEGDFEQESWLMLELTALDIENLYDSLWEELIPLDIERYDNKQGSRRYALILQRNVHKAPWRIHLDVGFQQIREDESNNFRLVDFDMYNKSEKPKDGYSYQYDAIMVQNLGPHYVDWSWTMLPEEGFQGAYNYPPLICQFLMFGWQATDIEWTKVNDMWAKDKDKKIFGPVLMVFSERDFHIGLKCWAGEAESFQPIIGRIVDLEGGPEGTKDWYSQDFFTHDYQWNVIYGVD